MGKDLKGKELGAGYHQKQSNGRYYYRFINRFGKRVSVSATTIHKCRSRAREAVKLDTEKKNVCFPNMTLNDLFDKWCYIYSLTDYRATSRRVYKSFYNKHLKKEFGHLRITMFTPLFCREIYLKYKKEHTALELEKWLTVMNSLFDMAVMEGFCDKNHIKQLRYPARKQSKRRALTDNEISTFFMYAFSCQYYYLYLFAINTGLRVGEICGLKMDDIDLENNIVSVTKQLSYSHEKGIASLDRYSFTEPKTPTSVRNVPLNSDAKLAIQEHLKMREIIKQKYSMKTKDEFSELVFTTKYFTPLSEQHLNQMIKTVIDKINWYRNEKEKIKYFTMHDFRLTFATQCYYQNIDVKTLQSWMGHKSSNTTMDIYVKLDKHNSSEKMKMLNITSRLLPEDDFKNSSKIGATMVS